MKQVWPFVGLGVFYLHADRLMPMGGIGAEVVTGAVALVMLQAFWLLRE
jgi:hypothetical protein